ncbi:hypothetical protein M0D69_07170 [Caballeronia sp. SEWSISQ10-4 2]|uniref:hypothetical protein n=1 Tax=Caballeronia sp. SEWSISQ10-4 2 TaxID=2937438 RepID=UPI0026544258|nr:hypothetical protein [Caballeronia sp. SEWSISQ10-4 2]MDN7177803.1 hypothetical protein [Caballeronia sp. SEWSISQ10-4 2]
MVYDTNIDQLLRALDGSRPAAGTLNGLLSLDSVLTPPYPQNFGLGTSIASLNVLGTLPAYRPINWIAVRQRFEQFHRNLALTQMQWLDGINKRANVVSCLNRAYYGTSSNTDNSFYVGSWSKDTAMPAAP